MNGSGDSPYAGKKTKKSVEKIYQKKTQLEHILLRPDTYIGSIEKVTQSLWVVNKESKLVMKDITYVPGLFKIYDEIIVNAADNKQRDKHMTCIKIVINQEKNLISVWNNGKGVPVVMHKEQNMYVPSLIFGHLLTSSNFDDTEKKVTGGRNGFGAKLCNVFSTKFSLETVCSEYKKSFKQCWVKNMSGAAEPEINSVSRDVEDFTSISFEPDLEKFGMNHLDDDTVALFTKRAYDIAACVKGIKVFLNGSRIKVTNFKEYVDMFIDGRVDDNNEPLKVAHEVVNNRWEVAITMSDRGFSQVSYVNSINTIKGGRHVDYIADMLTTKIIDVVKKKEKKGGLQIKPFQIKTHMWVFVNCLIENPTFDSQTKETLTVQSKKFGSTCTLTDAFINRVNKCGIVESIMNWMKFKELEKMSKKCGNVKSLKIKGIPKLDDANDAGSRNSADCTLILTEGDSAKTLAVAGLSIIGRDKYGVFPLRGKLLNVREAPYKQIMENAEITSLIKILGLRYKEPYNTDASLKTLRYGKVMIMTDQDQDGSHIKGLVINFFHHNWPKLLQQNFIEEFITPIIKITKKNFVKSFYSLPEFEEWKQETENWQTYKVKYYKGLGTSTSKEAKEYFSDLVRHKIPFRYEDNNDDESIILAFSKKKIEERKEWLTNFLVDRKMRAEEGLPEVYLYGKTVKDITFSEFVNKELILFSNMDNERSIPSIVDGFKPGQRKVMFACFKRNIIREVKVAQLAGSIAEISAYHHGEMSLMGTIINLAQDYVGSNNINLLRPIGQFGTRLHGGKDSASPRYIFTALSLHSRMIFPVNDDFVLRYNYDDNTRIEPIFYVPIIPMVLVNGSEGIGTGWSTKIPNYDPREVVSNIRLMLEGKEIKPMIPWYKNFKGTIQLLDDKRYCSFGEAFVVDDNTVVITELPLKVWTQNYKESTLEQMMNSEKSPATIINYKEYHTDTSVHFVITMTPENLQKAESVGIHKFFKLQTTLSINSMVLFDSSGCIKRYASAAEIFAEFYTIRLLHYNKRKAYLEGMLGAEALRLSNQARFILEKTEGKITIENKKKKEMIKILVDRKFDSDPVKKWKHEMESIREKEEGAVAVIADMSIHPDDANQEEEEKEDEGKDFNYLLGMQLWYLTYEKKEALLKEKELKCMELDRIKDMTTKEMWIIDLDTFIDKLNVIEEEERESALMIPKKKANSKGSKAQGRAKKTTSNVQMITSDQGIRVVPDIGLFEVKVAVKKEKKEKVIKPKREKKVKKEAHSDNSDDSDISPPKKKKVNGIKKEIVSNSDSDASLPSLKDRIKAKSKPAKPIAKKVDAKQSTIGDSFKKTTVKKVVKKAQIISSDEESEENEIVIRPKKKTRIDSDSGDDFCVLGDSDDSDLKSPPKRSNRSKPASTKYVFSDESDELF